VSYEEAAADRIRAALSGTGFVEKPMTAGGRGFLVNGHLACGIRSDGLVIRVGAEAKAEIIGERHVRPHRVGTRQTSAFVVVDQAGFQTDTELHAWIQRALDFVASLG
jgi:hypothetical protein